MVIEFEFKKNTQKTLDEIKSELLEIPEPRLAEEYDTNALVCYTPQLFKIVLNSEKSICDTIDYKSNLDVYVYGLHFSLNHDDCIEFLFGENLNALLDDIQREMPFRLSEEEKNQIKDEVSNWIYAHSCADADYYE